MWGSARHISTGKQKKKKHAAQSCACMESSCLIPWGKKHAAESWGCDLYNADTLKILNSLNSYTVESLWTIIPSTLHIFLVEGIFFIYVCIYFLRPKISVLHPSGYAFLLFQEESSVQALIDACLEEDGKLYLCVSSPTIKDKPVSGDIYLSECEEMARLTCFWDTPDRSTARLPILIGNGWKLIKMMIKIGRITVDQLGMYVLYFTAIHPVICQI